MIVQEQIVEFYKGIACESGIIFHHLSMVKHYVPNFSLSDAFTPCSESVPTLKYDGKLQNDSTQQSLTT